MVVAAVLAVTAMALVVGQLTWGAGEGAEATRLTVVAPENGEVVYGRDMTVGETFELRHIHSVTRREVVETFSVLDEDTVAIETLVFDEHGPNLPAGPSHVGEHVTYERDGAVVRVDHHGHPIGTLPLLVGGAQVDHTMVFEDERRVRLLELVPTGTRLEVTVGETTMGGSER